MVDWELRFGGLFIRLEKPAAAVTLINQSTNPTIQPFNQSTNQPFNQCNQCNQCNQLNVPEALAFYAVEKK